MVAVGTMPDGVSRAFAVFATVAPEHAVAWMGLAHALDEACALDDKTKDLAYLAVLAALGLQSGIAFHVQQARRHGATRDEVISAILVGLPSAGHRVISCLPAAVDAYDDSPYSA